MVLQLMSKFLGEAVVAMHEATERARQPQAEKKACPQEAASSGHGH